MSVAELEGVDLWVEGRLNEEGIETVQAMATAPIERLVGRTYFSTARIVCWVDQALLYMHAGNGGQWMASLRAAGVHRATDLISILGYPYLPPKNGLAGTGQPIDLQEMRDAVDTLVEAGPRKEQTNPPPLNAATVFEICRALLTKPNLVYVLNYYQARPLAAGASLAGWGAIRGRLTLAEAVPPTKARAPEPQTV